MPKPLDRIERSALSNLRKLVKQGASERRLNTAFDYTVAVFRNHARGYDMAAKIAPRQPAMGRLMIVILRGQEKRKKGGR